MSSVDIDDLELGAQEDFVVLEGVPKMGRVPLELWSLCTVSSVNLHDPELGALEELLGLWRVCQKWDEFL
jgi:hypothetical protein